MAGRSGITVKVTALGLSEAVEKAKQLTEELKKANSLVKELADALESLKVDIERE